MKKQLLILVMMLMPIAASADAVVIDGIYYNLITKGGANVAEVTKNTGDYRGNVVIPSSISYEGSNYLVNAIGKEAFYFCTELNSVSIPESIESIGSGAFYMCTGLTSVHISDLKAWCNIKFIKDSDFYEYFCNPLFYTNHLYLNNEEILHLDIPEGVISINNYAFYNCSNFTSITFPSSVTSIGNHAFENCSGLVSANFNEGTTTIGDYAFQNCNSLESLTLPNSITTIGQGSFRGCNGLTLLKMGNSINTIAKYAFDGCSKLTSLVLPNSVSTIRESAFANCSLLQSLTFGKSVSSIYSYAFSGCPELTDVYCLGNFIQGVNIDAFNGSYIEYATLHVPELLIDIYSSVEPWKNFKNIVRIKMPEHTLTYIVDEDVYKTYQLEEGESITPEPAPTEEGYTFSGWSEIPKAMPDHDVIVTGSFTVNKYKVTYIIDGEVFATDYVEYGATIVPPTVEDKEGYTFDGWTDVPKTMPAYDLTIYGSFTSGIAEIVMETKSNVRIYSPNGKKIEKLQKGLNIVVLEDGTVKKIVVK